MNEFKFREDFIAKFMDRLHLSIYLIPFPDPEQGKPINAA